VARLRAPLFMPYLGDGERDDPRLRGAFVGMSDRHGRAELAYAVLEGIAFAVAETIGILREAGSPLFELRVGGGGARLATLGQVKADVLGVPVIHLDHDSAPIGVALLAASRCGHADAARAALGRNLERADRFEPDAGCSEAVADRYRWFRDVRESPAVRL
jgi:xylulokinase